MWISNGGGVGGGLLHMDKKILNVNIIYFENVDKPEGGALWAMTPCK